MYHLATKIANVSAWQINVKWSAGDNKRYRL